MYCDTVVSSNPGFQESQFSFTVITIFFKPIHLILWLKYPQFHVRPLDGRDVGGEFGDKEPGILQGNGAGGEVNHLFYEIKPTFQSHPGSPHPSRSGAGDSGEAAPWKGGV